MTTGPSGYTPHEIVFGKHNRTNGPRLAEPKGVAKDAVHYFQRREELIALARKAMIHMQGTMAHKYKKRRRMSPNFSKRDRVSVCRQHKILAIRLVPIGMGPTRLWPRRLTTYVIQYSMLFKWTNGG